MVGSTRTKTPKSLPTHPCAACGLDVPGNSKAVGCDCDKWYHLKCTELNDRQYKALVEDVGPLTWVCRDCLQLKSRTKTYAETKTDTNSPANTTFPENTDGKTKHLEEIIKLLMSDIDDLKAQLVDTVSEREKLSELVVKKIEVIYKLEQTLHNFAVGYPNLPSHDDHQTTSTTPEIVKSPHPRPTGKTTPVCSKAQHTTPSEENKQHLIDKPEMHSSRPRTTNQPDALIIGDSIMRGAASIMKNERGINIANQVIPGAKIRDFSRFISNAKEVPRKVIINIGSNNLSTAKTPNHVMRPIWLTLYAAQKYFKNTNWYVNSILYRRDLRDKHVRDNNDALKFMCDQLGLTYINTIDDFTDDCYGFDGIHPNKKGAHLLADIIAEAAELGGTCSRTTSETGEQDSYRLSTKECNTLNRTELSCEDKAEHSDLMNQTGASASDHNKITLTGQNDSQ